MWPLFIIALLAIGPLLSADLRSQPMFLILSGVCWLALIGLAYGKYRDFQARENLADLNRRR